MSEQDPPHPAHLPAEPDEVEAEKPARPDVEPTEGDPVPGQQPTTPQGRAKDKREHPHGGAPGQTGANPGQSDAPPPGLAPDDVDDVGLPGEEPVPEYEFLPEDEANDDDTVDNAEDDTEASAGDTEADTESDEDAGESDAGEGDKNADDAPA
jgi:hypothetical protein